MVTLVEIDYDGHPDMTLTFQMTFRDILAESIPYTKNIAQSQKNNMTLTYQHGLVPLKRMYIQLDHVRAMCRCICPYPLNPLVPSKPLLLIQEHRVIPSPRASRGGSLESGTGGCDSDR